MVPLLHVETEPSPEGLRVVARGEMDIASAEQVAAALLSAESGGASTITLDLSQVTFFDSTAARVVIEASLRSRQNGGRLRLLTSAQVDRVIDLCGIREQLPLD